MILVISLGEGGWVYAKMGGWVPQRGRVGICFKGERARRGDVQRRVNGYYIMEDGIGHGKQGSGWFSVTWKVGGCNKVEGR